MAKTSEATTVENADSPITENSRNVTTEARYEVVDLYDNQTVIKTPVKSEAPLEVAQIYRALHYGLKSFLKQTGIKKNRHRRVRRYRLSLKRSPLCDRIRSITNLFGEYADPLQFNGYERFSSSTGQESRLPICRLPGRGQFNAHRQPI